MVLEKLFRKYRSWRIGLIERKYYQASSDQERENLMADYYFHKAKININKMPKRLNKPLDEDIYFRKAYGCMQALDKLERVELLEKLGFYSVGNPFATEDLKKEPVIISINQ
jgi:hypothetical protein